ncbi:hypothetical protein [Nocardia acidivorans]|uniref:hypothetical protein n=1 Tax=Nocardia acidivorans TaxID=404580 RepID=UPI000B26EB31
MSIDHLSGAIRVFGARAIDHDLDLIGDADHIIDMGPGGGPDGGRIIATGTPRQPAATRDSLTGRYLRRHQHLAESGR